MIVDCPSMEPYRRMCNIGSFVQLYKTMVPRYSAVKIYAMYLNDGDFKAIQKKALALYCMKVGWHKLMGIPLVK